MFTLSQLNDAIRIIRDVMPATPQYAWPLLAKRTGCQVWVKHENHTPLGAFKMRGGLVLLHSLCQSHHNIKGVVTATRGNHGQSIAFACQRHTIPAHIIVPKGNCPEKNAAMRALGANLIEYGDDFDVARAFAQQFAKENAYYNILSFHPELIRGVATYALELFNAVQDLDTVYVSIGMGSGICGLIKTRDLLGLKTKIIGVVSAHADAFAQSIEQGKIITTTTANTLADGLACRMPHAEAFEIIRQGAENIIRVSDDEVRNAIRIYHEDTHNSAEGAGAAALAGLLQNKHHYQGKKVAVILSGANISRDLYSSILC